MTENRTIQKIVEGMKVAAVVGTMSVARIRKAVEGDVTVALMMLMIQMNPQKAILIQPMNVKKQKSRKAAAAVVKNQRAKSLKRKANPIVIVVIATTAIAVQENGLSIVIKVNIKRKPKRVNMLDPAPVPDLVTAVTDSTNIKRHCLLENVYLSKCICMYVPSVDSLVCILMQDYH